jgi:hypothetical protein
LINYGHSPQGSAATLGAVVLSGMGYLVLRQVADRFASWSM